MKSIFSVTTRSLPGTEGRMGLVHEWPERMSHILPMVPYLSANYVMAHIRARLPRSSEYRAYRKGLEVAKVRGMSAKEWAYVLHVDMKSPVIRKMRPREVLLYVHLKKRNVSAESDKKATEILVKNNPWTFESLPFTPNPKVGFVTTKRTRPAVVQEVTAKRLKERRIWAKDLARAGHREIRKDKRLKIPKKARLLPNIALEALKLEFGLGGARPKPLWRVGVRRLIKSGLRSFIRNPKYFTFPLTRPSYRLWKKWPLRTKHSIPSVQALKYVPFQKKLAISH